MREPEAGRLPHHSHCGCWPECCCWCGIGLTEEEARWQDIEFTPRNMVIYRMDMEESHV